MHLSDILTTYGVPTAGSEHRHGRAGWVQTDCPYCRGIGQFHLGFNTSNGAVNCWRCGRHRLLDTLCLLTGRERAELRELLDGLTLDRSKAPVAAAGRLVLPTGLEDGLRGVHAAYLTKRGHDPAEIVRLWEVQGLGPLAKLRWRLFIPIHFGGRVVSWTTRSINRDADRPYIAASPEQEAVPHRDLLYGEDYCRQAIIICEGPFDAWRIGPGAVATCGTGYSSAQVARMARYPLRVVCFDNETTAQRRANELADTLALFPGETHIVVLETGSDPGEAEAAEVAELRAQFLGG